eukprot:TRINITY_DN3089_c0_g1_i1.p1 TRINITY_DN3089_c0_g1~~TRINITY_DN3089_c0_g1_i1.p1  ORF type:complete len:367 (-),score=77.61 TRINITY_DN3089_c0_g1_i1:87-1124(-)
MGQTSSKNATIFIAIMSAFRNMAAREAIRLTWMKNLKDGVTAKFIMADPNYWFNHQSEQNEADVKMLNSLKRESEAYGDILFFSGIAEGYQRLGDRLLALVNFATGDMQQEGIKDDFIMKTDDDSYIVVDRLYETIQKLPRRRVYWGFFLVNSQVVADVEDPVRGAWANPEFATQVGMHYPSYAQGGGYILSMDIIRTLGDIHSQRYGIPLKVWALGPEDSQMGAWLVGLDIDRVQEPWALWKSDCRTMQGCFCAEHATVVLHGLHPSHFESCYHYEMTEHNLCKCSLVEEKLMELSDREEIPREGKFRSSKRLSGLVVTVIVIVVFVVLFFFVAVIIAFAKVCK